MWANKLRENCSAYFKDTSRIKTLSNIYDGVFDKEIATWKLQLFIGF